MVLFEVGRSCLKIAGRDAGKKCVVVEQLDNTYVLVDGETRRKKVNLKHLEPSNQMIEIKEKASHEEVKEAFQKLGIKIMDTTPKQAAPRVKRQKKQKNKAEPKNK
ncbi:50S ribosomal protein L14e [Candidatus Woesearchaeota archaeon]|nr:50S ribosomal protein L14e [Candidatus Woesearchaeota archaeon]